MVGILLALLMFMTGEWGIVTYRLTGLNIADFPGPVLTSGMGHKFAIVTFSVILIDMTMSMASKVKKAFENNTVVEPFNAAQGNQANLNNQAKNVEVMSYVTQIIFVVVVILINTPSFIIYSKFENVQSISNENIVLIDFFESIVM